MFMLQVNGVIANASFMTRSLDSESKPWQFARVAEDTRWEHVTSLHPNNMPAELTSNHAEVRHTILTGCKLYFPNDRCSAISYIRLLLDDSMLKAHQHRIGLEASNSCDCGLVIDNIEHFLLQCTLYDDLRHALKHDVTNVWERCGSRRTDAVWSYLCNSWCLLSPVISLHMLNAVTFCQQHLISSGTLRDSCNTLSSLHISSSSVHRHYHTVILTTSVKTIC